MGHNEKENGIWGNNICREDKGRKQSLRSWEEPETNVSQYGDQNIVYQNARLMGFFFFFLIPGQK